MLHLVSCLRPRSRPGPKYLSLPVGLHVEGGRHRTWSDRTAADLLDLFRCLFMPRRPEAYGNMLRDKIAQHGSTFWLVNTGWTGGAYGVGSRMPIKATRALMPPHLRDSWPIRNTARMPISASTCLFRPLVYPKCSSTRVAPEMIRRPLTKRPKSWCRCSPRISISALHQRRHQSRGHRLIKKMGMVSVPVHVQLTFRARRQVHRQNSRFKSLIRNELICYSKSLVSR